MEIQLLLNLYDNLECIRDINIKPRNNMLCQFGIWKICTQFRVKNDQFFLKHFLIRLLTKTKTKTKITEKKK